MGLEKMLGKLRSRLSRLGASAAASAKEKAQLLACIKELEMKLRQMADIIEQLQEEKEQLLKNCLCLEEWKTQQTDNTSHTNGKVAQLEEALAKCC